MADALSLFDVDSSNFSPRLLARLEETRRAQAEPSRRARPNRRNAHDGLTAPRSRCSVLRSLKERCAWVTGEVALFRARLELSGIPGDR